MANTNFSALTSEQLTIWSRDFWRVARNMSFINQFAGSGPNAMVQRINELTQSEKGLYYIQEASTVQTPFMLQDL